MPPKKGTEAYNEWRNSEKYEIFIKSRTGKNNPMFGKKNPIRAEMNRQQAGINHPRFGKKDIALSERNRCRKGWKNPIRAELTDNKQEKIILVMVREVKTTPITVVIVQRKLKRK